MPLKESEAIKLIKLRHREWKEFEKHWRFLADSYEGGNRYKHADYSVSSDQTSTPGQQMYATSGTGWGGTGVDPVTGEVNPVNYGQISQRNLVPHLSETGMDGQDIYAMRLHRTPVPRNLARTTEVHLTKIYSREVRRSGSPELETWWANTDGRGSAIDQWMNETISPMLMVLGQLDLCFDHPRAPKGANIVTLADAKAAGVTGCIGSIILPENMLWWQLDEDDGTYEQCLVFERQDDGTVRYRHWTETESNAYTVQGRWIEDASSVHSYGCVPVRRVFDRRKVRCRNVGQPRWEAVADLQLAIYNARSEMILSDVQQSHAQLMGPEKALQKDAVLPIGPGNVLPIYQDPNGGTIPWSFLDPPKGAQAALREHIKDYQDECDRDGSLLKPAGMTSGSTTGQSGISKQADQQDGNAVLSQLAEVLQNAEYTIASLVEVVLNDGDVTDAEIEATSIAYPKQFDLFALPDLTAALGEFQALAQASGISPVIEAEFFKRILALAFPGLDDETIDTMRAEVDAMLAGKSQEANETEESAESTESIDDATAEATMNPSELNQPFATSP